MAFEFASTNLVVDLSIIMVLLLGRHAEMDMAVTEGTLWQRILSPRGFTAISHYFVMDWAAVWTDIAGGLLLAGALAAWVPDRFWQAFFLVEHPLVATIWGPLVGPRTTEAG